MRHAHSLSTCCSIEPQRKMLVFRAKYKTNHVVRYQAIEEDEEWGIARGLLALAPVVCASAGARTSATERGVCWAVASGWKTVRARYRESRSSGFATTTVSCGRSQRMH